MSEQSSMSPTLAQTCLVRSVDSPFTARCRYFFQADTDKVRAPRLAPLKRLRTAVETLSPGSQRPYGLCCGPASVAALVSR